MEVLGKKSSVEARAKLKLERDLGPILLDVFHDSMTSDIMLNPDGRVWVERFGQKMTCVTSLSKQQGQAIIETVAGFHNLEVTRKKPLIEAEFPLDGSRFCGQVPPTVSGPTFSIRKRASRIFTLEEYVEHGILSQEQYNIVVDAVKAHRNIIIIGGTGTGKTTLINAIINSTVIHFPHERIIIIEDTGEVQCSAENHVKLRTSLEVDMTDLLKTTLRMRPDRILVGEVRGPEALDLLDAWNTGHEGGVASLHSNDAESGLTRLRSLVSRHPSAPKDIEYLIGEAVHMVIHISRSATGRFVESIISVQGYKDGQYILSTH